MKWFVKCIRNYVNFDGRARRSEYWYFILFSILFMLVARFLDWLLLDYRMTIFSTLFSLFIFLPQISVMVRRLHDTGRSGKIVLWYYIAAFIWVVALLISGFSAFAGAVSGSLASMPVGFLLLLFGGMLVFLVWGIFFLVWFCTPGTPGENKYGPDPKAVAEAE